jgi:serine/threonine protein kinase
MSERDPRTPSERSSTTGSWQKPPLPPAGGGSAEFGDPPTVRSGSGSHEGSGTGRKAEIEPAQGLPRPGDRLDSFLLEEAIGVGGMGAVFRAHDNQLEREVALKILPPEQARDPEAVQRFYQEGRAAARLDHETIARVYSIGHASNYHYIAFEFIEGSTLRQRVEAGGILPVADAINYTLQMATALVHATERGVVHRDVKPSNIIVTPHGRAKLVDMGLARRFERGGDAGLTQTGMTLGTFDYISPEQARDPRSVDVRSDLYSLGCTLFYMLAGRPPFPDGTVLQKLLQHQEEPPPDVRALNPSVPAELAAILTKLMAKDRDRRYQTPEQLVRDLLMVAGSLNLRSVSPEGLVWIDGAQAPPWERHLVWGIPTLAFAAIIVFLMWSGQQPETTPAVSLPPELVSPAQKGGKKLGSPALAPVTPQPLPTEAPATSETPPRAVAKNVVDVRKGDDLARLLAESPPGSTLLLKDDGPYDIQPGAALLNPRDLTIYGNTNTGLQPVIRLAPDASGSRTAAAILDLKGGRLKVVGVEFQVDSDERDAPVAAIRTLDSDLTLLHCVARRVGTKPARGQTAGLHIRETSVDTDWKGAAEVVVDASHFEGGQYAILAEGPVDLTVRDATIGVARTASIASINKAAATQAATIRLNHTSILAGDGPVFRLVGISPRIQANDCVFAPPSEGIATLVSADAPATLDWRGRDNLYARIAIFLQADRASTATFNPIRSSDAWIDDPSSVREAGSTFTTARIWSDPAPSLALSSRMNNPSLAFRLLGPYASGGRIGARRGPFGAITPPLSLAMKDAGSDSAKPLLAESAVDRVIPSPPPEPTPKAVTTEPPAPMQPMRDPADEPPVDMPPPMEIAPIEPGAIPAPAVDPDAMPAATPRPASAEPEGPPRSLSPNRPLEGKLIRTAAQLAAALGQVGGRGETLRIASDANLEMSSCELRGMGSWIIQGEPGKTRPRITFRPRAGDAKIADAWTVWMNILSGSLKFERVDLVLPKADAPQTGGWGAFAVASGTDLSVSDCTVTIEGSAVRSAVIVVPAGREANGFGEPELETLAATVRLKDSLFRAGGDLVDVTGDRRLDLEVENVLVATAGSLLHGHGRVRGVAAEPIKFTLRRLTSRTEGGLVRLDSTPTDPELPQVEVVARDSVLATNGKGSPLVQVDGQDDPESLRDRVRWDGNSVAYHQISNYRRDQVARPGELPTSFDKSSWELAVGRRETGSTHGVAMFAEDWPANRSAWSARPADLRLKPDSSAIKAGAGTDLSLIPEPPPPRS